jgi:predicted KAP-like P-loop ATPase
MSLFGLFQKNARHAEAADGPGVANVQDTQIGRPERPILTKDQDRLSRGPFIQKLANTLIDPVSNKSSGVVIGITGQWGSGKSSILNLLRKQLFESHPNAAIISFDSIRTSLT